MSVGVMKDYKLKQRNLRASHTLDSAVDIFFFSEKKQRIFFFKKNPSPTSYSD